MKDLWLEEVKALFPQIVTWRRYLHQHPEVSFHEVETAKFIEKQLRQWPIDAITTNIGGHGLVAEIVGDQAGPTIALRADIDALPIQDAKQVSYASKVPGVMHACGHDGHTAVMLAVAQLLSTHKSRIQGNVKLIFQHAEEQTPGGAKSIIASGLLDDISAIYGIHLWSPLPINTISTCAGPMMAAADEFTIEISGKGGHAGLPHEANDTVLIGSQLVVALQQIVSRKVDPMQAVVISVGSFHAGSTFNVIAEKAILQGTVRTFNEQVRDQVIEQMNRIVTHTAAMEDCQIELRYNKGFPALVNHSNETKRVQRIARKLFQGHAVIDGQPVMAGEDFAYYTKQFPGCFTFIGAGNPDYSAVYPHHHPHFDIDENAMSHAATLLLHLVTED